jgi:putative intracellular protease/amidase
MLPKKYERKVLLLVANGTEEMEAVITADVLRRGELCVDVVSVENTREIICARGINLIADQLLSDLKNANEYEALIIPGGKKGADTMAADSRVHNLLREFEQKRLLVALICAGKEL